MTPSNTTGAQALNPLAGLHGFLLSCAAKADNNSDAQVIRDWAREITTLACREQAGAVAVVPRGVYGPNDGRPGELYGDADWIAQNYEAVLQFLERSVAAPGSAIAARERRLTVAETGTALIRAMDDLGLNKSLRADIVATYARHIAALASRNEAPAASAVPKWIDDPHDIEQGQMLNPAWLKLHGMTLREASAPVQSTAPNAELLRGWKRYEKLRKLTPAAFNRLHAINVTGGNNFDDLVDALPEPSTPIPEQSAKGLTMGGEVDGA